MIEETNSEDVDGVDDEFEGSSSEAGSDSEEYCTSYVYSIVYL